MSNINKLKSITKKFSDSSKHEFAKFDYDYHAIEFAVEEEFTSAQQDQYSKEVDKFEAKLGIKAFDPRSYTKDQLEQYYQICKKIKPNLDKIIREFQDYD